MSSKRVGEKEKKEHCCLPRQLWLPQWHVHHHHQQGTSTSTTSTAGLSRPVSSVLQLLHYDYWPLLQSTTRLHTANLPISRQTNQFTCEGKRKTLLCTHLLLCTIHHCSNIHKTHLEKCTLSCAGHHFIGHGQIRLLGEGEREKQTQLSWSHAVVLWIICLLSHLSSLFSFLWAPISDHSSELLLWI